MNTFLRLLVLTLSLLLAVAGAASAQIISKVLESDDLVGGLPVGGISDVAAGPNGELFVSATGGVYRVDPGISTTRIIDATGDGAGNPLDGPSHLAVDPAGNAYVVGRNSKNVFKITPSGTITQILGSVNMQQPWDLAVDPTSGNVYVSHYYFEAFNNGVFRITPGGVISQPLVTASVPFGFRYPNGIAFDAAGNMYCGGEGLVLRLAPDGTVSTVAGPLPDLGFVRGVAVDSAGNVVFAGGLSAPEVYKRAPDGSLSTILDGTGDGSGNVLSNPDEVVIDSMDNVYVAGGSSGNVFRVTPAGVITQVIGSDGDGMTPVGSTRRLTIDAADNLYLRYSNRGQPSGVFRIGEALPEPPASVPGMHGVGFALLFVMLGLVGTHRLRVIVG